MPVGSGVIYLGWGGEFLVSYLIPCHKMKFYHLNIPSCTDTSRTMYLVLTPGEVVDHRLHWYSLGLYMS